MKSLKQYDSMEKAALLLQLFPKEQPGLVYFIEGMSISITQPEQRKSMPASDLAAFDKQLAAAKQAQARIEKHEQELYTDQELFVQQLCDETLAEFTQYCIRVYVSVRQHPNPRFVHAVHMLYG